MNIVLVCGGRDFKNRRLLNDTLNKIEIDCIVHGGAYGADNLASQWAMDRGVPEIIMLAPWKKFGHAAGMVRNKWMLSFVQVSLVVAFPGGHGTADMIGLAKKNNIKLMEVTL